MTTQELNTRLYEKMLAEQKTYRKWLLTQSPDEILNHAYKYTIREDILLSLEYNELSGKQAKALLKSPCPLDDIFKTLEKMELGHMQDVFDAVVARSNTVLQQDLVKSQHGTR